MKKPLYPVSDHAVLCYMERVMGVDVEAIRREIGHKAVRALEHPGCSGVVVSGLSLKISDGCITTVLHAHQADKRFRRARRRERDE